MRAASATELHQLCMAANVSSTIDNPFWAQLPYTDIFRSTTPDVLHQLYQGVLKHLITWCQSVMSEKELDRRIRRLPPCYGTRRLPNGISALAQVSGPERKNMAKILLGCLIGILPRKALAACTSLLNFIYLAQYTSHNETTLGYMQDALNNWHKSKDAFIGLGVRKDFNIPKFHSLLHYIDSIRYFGTTDNYNTEVFERLHIDFAKEGWRASNHRNELPQMVQWLARREKVGAFGNSIKPAEPHLASQPASGGRGRIFVRLTKHPSHANKPILAIEEEHRCQLSFSRSLNDYLRNLSGENRIQGRPSASSLPFSKLDVFYRFKLFPPPIYCDGIDPPEPVTIKASPPRRKMAGQFDTVIILDTEEAQETGLEGRFLTPVSLCSNSDNT